MSIKKATAWGIVGTGTPLMVDVVTEPYADRGPAKSWLIGAGKLAVAVIMAWAFSETSDNRETL